MTFCSVRLRGRIVNIRDQFRFAQVLIRLLQKTPHMVRKHVLKW